MLPVLESEMRRLLRRPGGTYHFERASELQAEVSCARDEVEALRDLLAERDRDIQGLRREIATLEEKMQRDEQAVWSANTATRAAEAKGRAAASRVPELVCVRTPPLPRLSPARPRSGVRSCAAGGGDREPRGAVGAAREPARRRERGVPRGDTAGATAAPRV